MAYLFEKVGGGSTVVANPTLSGTEAELTGLEVDGKKYKVPSGGSGGAGQDGAEGLGIFRSTLNTATTATNSISISTITVPTGRSLKVGDFIIANTIYGYLYQITAVGTSTVTVKYVQKLRGNDGADGTNGKDGTNGADGKDGVDGKDGQNGKSAYEIAVENGFVGTEAEWLASLKGTDGKDGQDGQGATVTALTSEELSAIYDSMMITFTISDVTYQAIEGMTWEEWFKSTYNTDDYGITSGLNSFGDKYVMYDSTRVEKTEAIVAGRAYVKVLP